MFSFISLMAEGVYTYGKAIDFQSGFVGSLWHPYMRLSQYDDNDGGVGVLNMLILYTKTSDDYQNYPPESRLLLKLSNDSILELKSFGEVKKYYECISIGTKLQDVYHTGRDYTLPDKELDLLLTYPITKVRIELTNGNRLDYEISEKHGKKVLKQLKESYKNVLATQKKRLKNVNSDLKDDF